jgi:hypothetical protein
VKLVDPDGEVNISVQFRFLMNAVYSIWMDKAITNDSNTTIYYGGCAITGVANVAVTFGIYRNPKDINAMTNIFTVIMKVLIGNQATSPPCYLQILQNTTAVLLINDTMSNKTTLQMNIQP